MGQEVHQPPANGAERARLTRDGRGEVVETPGLERRVVGHDRGRALAGADHRGGQSRTRIAWTLGHVLVVFDAAARAHHVTARLHRHGLVRVAAVPGRHGGVHRLEVEEGHRVLERVERTGEPALHDHLAPLDRPDLAGGHVG